MRLSLIVGLLFSAMVGLNAQQSTERQMVQEALISLAKETAYTYPSAEEYISLFSIPQGTIQKEITTQNLYMVDMVTLDVFQVTLLLPDRYPLGDWVCGIQISKGSGNPNGLYDLSFDSLIKTKTNYGTCFKYHRAGFLYRYVVSDANRLINDGLPVIDALEQANRGYLR